MSDNMTDGAISARASSLVDGPGSASRDQSLSKQFEITHYWDEDPRSFAESGRFGSANMSLRKHSETKAQPLVPSLHNHTLAIRGHKQQPNILVKSRRPHIASRHSHASKNTVDQCMKPNGLISSSPIRKDKLLLPANRESRSRRHPLLDRHRSAPRFDLFNDLGICSAGSSSTFEEAAVAQMASNTARPQKDAGSGAQDHEYSDEQSLVCKTDDIHPLSKLSWPFDEALLQSFDSMRGGGGSGSQPSTTGSQGLPGFVTAGATSSLFGYDFEGPIGHLFWT